MYLPMIIIQISTKCHCKFSSKVLTLQLPDRLYYEEYEEANAAKDVLKLQPINLPFFHVKWFTDHDNANMLTYLEAITPAFLFWLGVTLIGLLLSSLFNDRLQRIGFISAIHSRLDQAKPYLTHILRIGLALGLILQLVTSSYLAPEIKNDATWITIVIVIAIFGLALRKTLWISGIMLSILYIWLIQQYSLFHALDYAYYIGIIYYLFVAETKRKKTATPVLYFMTGLSLVWVALEKMLLPELAWHIAADYQIPTFGFSVENFILITAFIEIGLAWTFIVGILNRFISIIVTLVFITTTTVFGFKEIVGHTIIHTLLIMFIIEGEGTFTTPFHFHRSPILRNLFVLVNFCVLLFGMMAVYIWMS
jgi:hypothetical protein